MNISENIPDIKTLYRTQRTEKYISKRYPDFAKWLNDPKNHDWDPSLNWGSRLFFYENNIIHQPRCPMCGKYVSVYNGIPGKYCSSECAYKDPHRTDNIESTILSKYGVRHALQSEVLQEKFKSTMMERHGVVNPGQSKEMMSKAKRTCEQLYGRDELVKRQRESMRRNYIFSHKDIIGYTDNGEWIMDCHRQCDGCDDHAFITPQILYHDRRRDGCEVCTKLNPISSRVTSGTSLEKFVTDILDEHGIEYKLNIRDVIPPKELDIYIPSKHIAIECNGILWHCDKYKSKNYHIDKFNACISKDIQLITLWEDQIRCHPDICKSIIESKLGLINHKTYARKCDVCNLSQRETKLFLEQNHIQGYVRSEVRYGLKNKDGKLVCVMTFSKRSKMSGGKNDSDTWELTRYCSIIRTTVIGGASKLLNWFINIHHPSHIVSFSCNDISTGSMYEKLGFKNDGQTNTYFYCDRNTMKRYHRSSFSKESIKKKGFNIDGMTEKELMDMYYKNILRIYDCGKIKWSLNI